MKMSPKPIPGEALIAITRLREVERKVEQVAEAIQSDAIRHAPRHTGNLRRNIIVTREVVNGVTEFRVGWGPDAPYGVFVEFGTENATAQPHLRPAADKVRRQIGR